MRPSQDPRFAEQTSADRQTSTHFPSDRPPSQADPARRLTANRPERRGLGAMLSWAIVPMVIGLLGFGVLSSYDATPSPMSEGGSMMAAGAVLATADTTEIGKDYTLEFPTGDKDTDLLVWDYAAEDGDWVQLKADGVPLGEPFMILHAPRTVKVPVGAKVEVVGVKDGGGGITYAVNFPTLRTSIRNGTDVGSGNAYTLSRTTPGGAPGGPAAPVGPAPAGQAPPGQAAPAGVPAAVPQPGGG